MNVPNTITSIRILLVPIFLYELWQKNIIISVILFSAIMIGDVLDGYVARKLKQTTKLGTVLDSLADRIVMVPTFIILIMRYNLDPRLGMMLLTRDFVYLIGVLIIMIFIKERKRFIDQPLRIGKVTTLMLTATALAIIINFYPLFFVQATIILSMTAALLYIMRAVKNYKQIRTS
ncbi:MAG: CDP-alcohol phosphatidyltransferase family protein [archaeon]